MPEIPRRLPPGEDERLSVVVSRMAGGSSAGATRWARPLGTGAYRPTDAFAGTPDPVAPPSGDDQPIITYPSDATGVHELYDTGSPVAIASGTAGPYSMWRFDFVLHWSVSTSGSSARPSFHLISDYDYQPVRTRWGMGDDPPVEQDIYVPGGFTIATYPTGLTAIEYRQYPVTFSVEIFNQSTVAQTFEIRAKGTSGENPVYLRKGFGYVFAYRVGPIPSIT